MRSGSYYTLFAAHIVVGIFALAGTATAQPIEVTTDTTITVSASGDTGGAAADDDDGGDGGAAVYWFNADIDVLIVSPDLVFAGGAGGNGGIDAADDGGNAGGAGGRGFAIFGPAGTLTATDAFVYGGSGGNGSDGGTGGVFDTNGGDAGFGGDGILTVDDGLTITLTNSTVVGGNGGNGGAAGDAAGDATNAAQGGDGRGGGYGIQFFTNGSILSVNNTSVTGGDGGNGGTSLANATNALGGYGGDGITYNGANSTIAIGAGSVIAGGDGGAAGTGGTGGLAGADGHGVSLIGVNGTLTNHGTILGSDTGANAAVYIIGPSTLIENFGTIGAASGHTGNGIDLSAVSSLNTIHNHVGGIVQSTGFEAAVNLDIDSTLQTFINEGSILNAGGPAVLLAGAVGSFTNSGTIQGGDAGILIDNADVADTFFNTGGTIASTGSFAIGIFTDLGPNGITFDGGQISGNGAIFVDAVQTGAIGVKNADVSGIIAFAVPDATLNITASTLASPVSFDAGINNANFLSGGATTLAADAMFSSTGTLFFSLLEGANVVSNAPQNGGITQLTTIVNSHLTLNEDAEVMNKVLNAGVIEIAPGKILATKLLEGNGNYVFGVTDAATVGGIKGQNAGSSLNFTGASLEIKLTNPAGMFVAGTNFLLAEDFNGNTILGTTNGTLLTDNSALLSFLLYRGDAPQIGAADDGLLFAQVQMALLADIAGEGDDPNSIALGAALDEIGLDGDADIDAQMLALAMLPTNEDVNAMLDSLLPETDGVAYDIATDAGEQILDVASRRLDGLRGTTVASREYKLASTVPVRSNVSGKPSAVWGQAFGRAVDQSKHDYNEGYDAGTYGFAVGADTVLDNSKALLGIAFAYGQTDADGNGINHTDTDVDSYQLVLYGDHEFADAVYAKGLIGYGWHQNDIVRHDVGGIPGNNASGDYDATQFSARAEMGRAYAAGTNLTLIPRFDLTYAAYNPDSYSETGVGGLGLDVEGESLQSFRLGAGVLARWDVPLDNGGLFQPELRLNYRRDLSRERFETTSAFIGAPGTATFRTQGVEPSADILHLGVGAVLASAGGIDLRASYDLELKEDYTAHGGYIRASLPF